MSCVLQRARSERKGQSAQLIYQAGSLEGLPGFTGRVVTLLGGPGMDYKWTKREKKLVEISKETQCWPAMRVNFYDEAKVFVCILTSAAKRVFGHEWE